MPPFDRLDSRIILAAAMVLPGVGHVMADRAGRGLGFAFFTLVFAWLTTKFAAPDANFIGRHAGGLFVWALSLTDVYRIARSREIREERSLGGAKRLER
ncbi:hypothetical protein [Methylocella tundrae]|uniref:Uncharacterized protein n=1 Tax=Methylocella tundrae TaxID=227605 RepID=A0A4U8Z2S2_METTU|nr:hypothetical protein [Methylocella tundrae]WPP03603.1 hypothetical protein SIN04_14150 [Methylocella tundrae]VFU09722.1 conserved membrane protein of unknown function [Methylocella tundrae]